MPVRRSSTSLRQLLRGSSYLSRLPTKLQLSNRYSLSALMHGQRRGVAGRCDVALRCARRAASPIASSLREVRLGVEPRILDARDDERRVGEAGARERSTAATSADDEIFLHRHAACV